MSRFPLFFLGCGLVVVAAGCSGDAKDGDANESSDGGSASSNAGSGGGSSSSAGSGGGSAQSGGMYTAAEACDVFARASCSKAQTCGLVLARAATQLVCLQCDELTLTIIRQACAQDSPGAKDAAAVDRCVASINGQDCRQACLTPDVPGCDVFGDLPATTTMPDCDPRCTG